MDAAFVAMGGTEQPGLAATTLGSEPVLLACRPDHPLARRATVSVSELADEPFVDFTPGWVPLAAGVSPGPFGIKTFLSNGPLRLSDRISGF